MRNSRRLGLCGLLVLISGLTGWSQSAQKRTVGTQRAQITTLMYMTSRPASIESFRQHAAHISIIAPQSFSMDAQGYVVGEIPAEVLEIARVRKVAIMPLVTNRGFSQDLMHSVLDTPKSRSRVIRYLIYYALRDGYIGFQFDCEHINHAYRKRFTNFLREAAREFHKNHLLISVALVGKYADGNDSGSPGGYENWSGVYDYGALAQAVDFVSVMAYPQHAAFSGPGPLAGMPWVQKILDYTLDRVPASKVSLGVPTYGIRWVSAAGRWKTSTAAWPDVLPELLKTYTPEWDDTEKAHHIDIPGTCTPQTNAAVPANSAAKPVPTEDSDSSERKLVAQWNAEESQVAPTSTCSESDRGEVWFEDAESLVPKLELAVNSQLAWGISGWVLGMEDPDFWSMLDEHYYVAHPKTPIVRGSYEERARAAARHVRLNKSELAAASSAGL